MRPRNGVALAEAVRRLREVEAEGGNVPSSSTAAAAVRANFVNWVHAAEQVLQSLFTSVPLDRLHTERFWRIHGAAGEALDTTYQLIRDELDVQLSWLKQIIAMLEEEAARAVSAGATIGVLDTNALLHYRLFTELPWCDVLGSTSVRLVVPLRVVDELDAKKASRRKDLADRAATVLAHLERSVGARMGAPVAVQEGTEIEVYRPAAFVPDQRGPIDPDTEILDVCETLTFFAAAPAHIVTGDYGMRLRAKARNVPVARIPDTLRIAPPTR